MTSTGWTIVKDIVSIARDFFVILGFILGILYFWYRLLAGFFILCRLAVEVTSDTPFTDKRLVRCIIKLKNTGPSSVRIKDARLCVFRLDKNQLLPGSWDWPTWPSRGDPPPAMVVDVPRLHLDFQRLSFTGDGILASYRAQPDVGWLNLETDGEQQRMFLFNLEAGSYKIEFRIMGTPMFRKDSGIFAKVSNKMFSLQRYSQWVGTAVVEAEQPKVQTNK